MDYITPKRIILILVFFSVMALQAAAMMDERRVWETIVIDGKSPLSVQMTLSGVCYEVRDTIDMVGDVVDMPANCKLSFDGGALLNGVIHGNGCLIDCYEGDVIFGREFAITDVSNKEVSLGWFDLPAEQDVAGIISGLVKNPAVEVLNLAGRTFRTTYIDLHHSLSINGSGAVIVPLMKTENSYCGLFRCEDGEGRMAFVFSDFSVIGDEGVRYDAKVLGDRLFHFINCERVLFDHVVIGNIAGGYGTSQYGYVFNAGLIACYDVKKLGIEKCEFFNNRCFEWICDIPVKLHRKEIDVFFCDNYIHDAHEGATPVFFLCNRLDLSRNIVRDCRYSGSLFNAHGYYSYFRDNDIRECVYSSIFDTCEYGDTQKTLTGEVAYYSDEVECCNNYCDCANATLLVTWAKRVTIKDNYLSGMCLCNAQGCGSLGQDPDTSFILPTNKSITIVDNVCYGDHVDNEMTLSFFHNFIRISSVYYLGGRVLIEGNTFRRSSFIDDYPFSISNMKEIVMKKNMIQGCYLYDLQTNKYGLLNVQNTYSVFYPLDDIDVAAIDISNNTIADSNIEFVVQTIDGEKLYTINKQETANNLMVLRSEAGQGN